MIREAEIGVMQPQTKGYKCPSRIFFLGTSRRNQPCRQLTLILLIALQTSDLQNCKRRNWCFLKSLNLWQVFIAATSKLVQPATKFCCYPSSSCLYPWKIPSSPASVATIYKQLMPTFCLGVRHLHLGFTQTILAWKSQMEIVFHYVNAILCIIIFSMTGTILGCLIHCFFKNHI